MSQMTELFITIAVRTSKPTSSTMVHHKGYQDAFPRSKVRVNVADYSSKVNTSVPPIFVSDKWNEDKGTHFYFTCLHSLENVLSCQFIGLFEAIFLYCNITHV
jgi:hypothetical protein